MKGVDIFCKSQAATSICLSIMDQNSASSPSSAATLLNGAAAIDRHNPIIKDSRRNPKKKKNSRIPSADENENQQTDADADATSSLSKLDDKTDATSSNNVVVSSTSAINVKKSWSCTNPGDFLSPPGSTRFLLREKHLSDSAEETSNKDDPPPSDSSSHQVVVMRVSLHCRGCEKKLRKHLSRMEGVTSFNIDFAAKKVTVAGNVAALDLVSIISKVMKNAQLWSSSNPTPETRFDFQTKGAAAV